MEQWIHLCQKKFPLKSHVENEMSKMNLPETVPAVV